MSQRVICLISKTLSVLHYQNTMITWKLLPSQQQGTHKLFHKCQKRTNMSFWGCAFSNIMPLLRQLLQPVWICRTLDGKYNRNFNLKRKKKKKEKQNIKKKRKKRKQSKERKQEKKHKKKRSKKGKEKEKNFKIWKKVKMRKMEKKRKKDTFVDETSRWECWLYHTAHSQTLIWTFLWKGNSQEMSKFILSVFCYF